MTTRTPVATPPVSAGRPPLSRLGPARIPGPAGGGPVRDRPRPPAAGGPPTPVCPSGHLSPHSAPSTGRLCTAT